MPYGFSITGKRNAEAIDKIREWSEESFGKQNDKIWMIKDRSWKRSYTINIYFEDEVNATAFKLRWM